MRISDWGADVGSSDLSIPFAVAVEEVEEDAPQEPRLKRLHVLACVHVRQRGREPLALSVHQVTREGVGPIERVAVDVWRWEERRVGKGCGSSCRFWRWSWTEYKQ